MIKETLNRLTSPTPKFFKKLRNIGLIFGAVAAGIMGAPVTLPAAVTTAAGYLLVASGVLAGVSQLPVEDTEKESENDKF